MLHHHMLHWIFLSAKLHVIFNVRYICTNCAPVVGVQEGDVIELIEKLDDYWYLAHNADTGQEGMILAKEMKIVKNLPGQDKVVSGWGMLFFLCLA